MPFKSQAQRAWMHMHHPKMAKRWEKHTPKGKLPHKVGEALDPKSEVSVAQFKNELMKWVRESGIKPSEARELLDAFWSLYQVLPEIMPDTTPEEFGRAYLEHWRETGMITDDEKSEANMVQMHSIGEMFGMEEGTDRELAIKSAGEEWKAYDDYGDRADRAEDPDLRDLFLHAQKEEMEHLKELEAWLKGTDPCEDEHEEELEGEPPPMSIVFGEDEEGPKPELSPLPLPTMESVFRIKEAPIQNRPPPGSQPVKPTDWNQLGQRGQALKQGLTAMQTAGQEVTPYKTPQGDTLAFPKDAAPGRGPLKADVTKGTWGSMTGSQTGGSGTPFSSQAPSTTMK